MVLLEVTAQTWIVTGLGFGIVLVLLFCLVFILMFFGWIMQQLNKPKAPKPDKPVEPAHEPQASDEDKAAIAMALSAAGDDDQVAIAMALYLYHGQQHDLPTAIIYPQARTTAWNAKEIGLNNKGF